MPIKNRIAELHDEIAAWRRDIHQHPELLYDTPRTSALVVEKLTEVGCDEVVTGIGKSGVVGVIRGKATGSGRVIGLRADMDALPIFEATGLPYASKVPGKMHACGHDGHTAMLLGAAKYLAETRNFDGTVVLIFQPAEEGGKGGLAMCRDGMMDRWGIQEVYAIHNLPGLPAGAMAIRPGPLLASVDTFTIQLQGQGGHAADPHVTVDPTLMMAHVILALQSVIARNADPVQQGVLSVTSAVTGSTAYNVIPGRAELRGTVRTHDAELRSQIECRLNQIVEGIAASFGGSAEVIYERGVPVTVNAEAQTGFAAEAARVVTGDCGLVALGMAGEDFSFMLEERPGAMINLGNGAGPDLHHPGYDFNDDILPVGCSWFVELVERRMPAG
ncbi:M20 aminoacylase family protein [Pseudodonghicola xiamenensis]|uniref:Amidohydrolase n=1 Tax=Pseudodonghicola xiamenensis TaxID=337702 RepID=A0A8J3MCR4_9RHOB|nr:M20 aminoacylase family protein [Pseudodonghicola xiamenensis]GHG79204.1 amidohydrolase [Pseudodonghicola xiamenensis]